MTDSFAQFTEAMSRRRAGRVAVLGDFGMGDDPDPDAIAHAFGVRLQREFGSDWPRLIGIAAGAAMAADHLDGGDRHGA